MDKSIWYIYTYAKFVTWPLSRPIFLHLPPLHNVHTMVNGWCCFSSVNTIGKFSITLSCSVIAIYTWWMIRASERKGGYVVNRHIVCEPNKRKCECCRPVIYQAQVTCIHEQALFYRHNYRWIPSVLARSFWELDMAADVEAFALVCDQCQSEWH